MKLLPKILFAAAALLLSPLSSAFCLFTPPYSDTFACTSPTVPVYEYVNDINRRRILLSEPAEITFVESGSAGPGWHRTGLQLSMLPASYNQSYVTRLEDVCRFYSPSSNSHLYTSSPAECAALKAPDSGWTFARIAFKSDPPVGGTCPVWSSYPVYRYFNNRAGAEADHRYSPDRTLKARLEADGWQDEGIAFCALTWFAGPMAGYGIAANSVVDAATCRADISTTPPTAGTSNATAGCIVVSQQPPMTHFVTVPKIYYQPENIAAHPYCEKLGGCYFGSGPVGDLFTAQSSSSLFDVVGHSFVQMSTQPGSRASVFGIYVNAVDTFPFNTGSPSVNPTFYFSTKAPPSPPTPGAQDPRVMPWKSPFRIDVEFAAYDLQIKTLVRGLGGHAIAHPILELLDTKSGHNIYVTVGAASGEAQGDFAAFDPVLGKTIVSTTFRANPAFRERVAGDAFTCNTNSSVSCDQGNNTYFRFRLRPVDVATVVATARGIDPALSPDIADYALDNFSFNVRVFGNAEMGLRINAIRVETFMRD